MGVAGREQQLVEIFDRQLHRQAEADHGVAARASRNLSIGLRHVAREITDAPPQVYSACRW
jgi:hypothetical protein